MQSTSMLLIAVCLFASVYTALGMKTVYYRDGQICELCADEQGAVPLKATYTPEEAGRRVIYSGQERIISRPSSSSSYIVDRADYSPQEACRTGGQWGPCGPNTKCDVIGGVPTCRCLPGYTGSPLNGCRHECETDYECGSQHLCKDFKCQPACSECGLGADCRVVNHRPVCECPKNYYGNPLVECRAECYGDRDCPGGKPACIYGVCKNPCDGACGVNADCNLRGLTPVCSCPRHMTGNPFVSCRPFTPEDLCANNPCGTNAQCRPGHDNTGAERPVCTCLPGYTGNALSHCVRGECQSDGECPSSRACINYACVDPCIGQCGSNAVCEARNHIAYCKCPSGYEGNAASSCVRQSRAYYPFSRYYKK